MAFKWTKKDTEAFNGIYGSVKQGLQDYNEARAGDLYDQELAKGVDTNWTATGVPQVDEYGLPVTDVSPQTRGLSINERRRNALNASADYLTGRGYRKQANEQYDQADQMGLRGLQREDAQLGIDTKKRAADEAKRIETAREEFNKSVKDKPAFIADLFNRDVIGSKDMAGKKVEYKPTKTGVMAWVVDENGAPVGSAKHYDNQEVENQAFMHYLQQTDPKAAATWQYQMKQADTQAERWDKEFDWRKAESGRKETADERRHQEALARLSALTGRNESRFAPQVFFDETGPVVFNPNSQKFVDASTGGPLAGDRLKKLSKIGNAKGDGQWEIEYADGKEVGRKWKGSGQPPATGVDALIRGDVKPPPAKKAAAGDVSGASSRGVAALDAAVKAQGTWGMLTPLEMVSRGVELGVPGAIEEAERRTRRFKPQTDPYSGLY